MIFLQYMIIKSYFPHADVPVDSSYLNVAYRFVYFEHMLHTIFISVIVNILQ